MNRGFFPYKNRLKRKFYSKSTLFCRTCLVCALLLPYSEGMIQIFQIKKPLHILLM